MSNAPTHQGDSDSLNLVDQDNGAGDGVGRCPGEILSSLTPMILHALLFAQRILHPNDRSITNIQYSTLIPLSLWRRAAEKCHCGNAIRQHAPMKMDRSYSTPS